MRKNISKIIVQECITGLPQFENFIVFEVASGISTNVFRLVNQEIEYYLRIAPEGENISTEALIHVLAAQTGVLVPSCIYYEDFNSNLSRSFMVTSKIVGQPVIERPRENSAIVAAAGKDLARLHSIKIGGFGWFDVKTPHCKKLTGAFSSYIEFIFNGLNILDRISVLKEKEVLSKDVSDKIHAFILDSAEKLDFTQAALSHSDLNNEHIFFNGESYSGLIDFGDACAMSTYHDLAKYFLNEPEDYRALLQGYLEINPLPAGYEDVIALEATIVAVKTLFWKATQAPHLLNSNLHYFDFLQKKFSG